MKKILILCAAMALVASTAFAVGIDLTVNACGNTAGASNDAGAIDCAGGGGVILLAVFQPAENYNDAATQTQLVGIDMIFDMQVAGTLATNGSAAFWDWDGINGCNVAALLPSRLRPSVGCTTYTNAWSVPNAGEGAGAGRRSTSTQRVAALCFRPSGSPLSTVANQQIFGIQLFIDGSTSLEAGQGGTCGGCTVAAGVVFNACTPGILSGAPTTTLGGPSLAGNCVGINAGLGLCAAVPTKKHTWGQLKSLYR